MQTEQPIDTKSRASGHSQFLICFLGSFLILLALFLLVQRPLPNRDYFKMGFSASDTLQTELTAAKLSHARSEPIYDFGLFGNSRSVMVGSTHLQLPEMSYFNLSVPGTSIRHSIVMLEELAKHNKLPRLSVISFDNAHLQFYGNAELRRPILQFQLAIRDAFSDKVALRERVKVVWRHLYQVAWIGVLRYFNWLELRKGLSFQLYGWKEPQAGVAYLPDGSRPEGNHSATAKSSFVVQAPNPSVLQGYLIKDLERVALLVRQGKTRVIIYESPLAPQARLLGGADHPVALATRRTFIDACSGLKLTCIPAPQQNSALLAPGWRDATHAPASSLGAFLSSIIKHHAK